MGENEKRDLFLINISVRSFVEFLLRGGDIDSRFGGSTLSAMQEGSRIHRKIQGKMGPDYAPEVPLYFSCEKKEYAICIEGRADGIIENAEGVTIDEIKGTYRKLDHMKEPVPVHLAQAKCYAYMYGVDRGLEEVRVRITYCNLETEEIRYFYQDYSFKELEKWFKGLLKEYDKWAVLQCRQYRQRKESASKLEFPFEYRTGQKELATQVYQTISEKKKLFLEAPTGVGKTVTTIFPAVKAIGAGKAERIFYLTAKTITRTVAEETFETLRKGGLKFRSVTITAKEKICFAEKTECNPDACPYAKGHYDRVNEALYDMLVREEVLTRAVIEEYAKRYEVCPFELTLDATLFSDAIVCDYNYVFDPDVKLERFFGDSAGGEYLFLIDEAHNLLERGREMFSAVLFKESFLSLKHSLKETIVSETTHVSRHNDIEGQMLLNIITPGITEKSDTSEIMTSESDNLDPEAVTNELTDEMTADSTPDSTLDSLYFTSGKGKRHGGKSILVKRGYADRIISGLDKCNRKLLEMKRECNGSRVVESIDGFVTPLTRLHSTISDYLEEREQSAPEAARELLDFYFDISHFLEIYEELDENYVKYTSLCDDGSFMIKLFCVNPSENLRQCMDNAVSTILFSATFLPIQYYKKLLGGSPEDYEVYAKSVFDPDKRGIFIADDVTSRYTRRSDEEYVRIAEHIKSIVGAHAGNYIVFCPSHSFMHSVYDKYLELGTPEHGTPGLGTPELGAQEPDMPQEALDPKPGPSGEAEYIIMQKESMSEDDREMFLELFEKESRITAFCVLGGIFSEGIDLKEEKLVGAVIVGTGLPQVCFERELLKTHFEAAGEDGFDYAYRYPGMNKVLQAAGRVIRTESDRGIIALLDDRFLQNSYKNLYPREWDKLTRISYADAGDRLKEFWKSEGALEDGSHKFKPK